MNRMNGIKINYPLEMNEPFEGAFFLSIDGESTIKYAQK
jgi:hypothetical protein